MSDKTCGTCRWWDDLGKGFGGCASLAVRMDIERVEHQHIEFAETFGCIHHQPRENDDER